MTRADSSCQLHSHDESDNTRFFLHLIVRCVTGVMLLVAGVSKFFPLQPILLTPTWELPASVVAVFASFEAVLGGAVLCGIRLKVTFWLTAFVYAAFVAFLSVRLLVGGTSCPCFAGVDMPVKLMLALDISCMAGLVIVRRQWYRGEDCGHLANSLMRGLATAIPSVLLLPGLYFGSIASFYSWIGGSRLIAATTRITVGKLHVGESRDVHFVVTNVGRDPVQIVGAKTSCSCTAFKDLPVEVRPGATESLRVTVTGMPRDANRFASYSAVLLCDRTVAAVTLRIDGAVVPNQ